MEAYQLCARDLSRKFCSKKTGNRIGWINFVLFGTFFVFLTSWALYELLCMNKDKRQQSVDKADGFPQDDEVLELEARTRS